ncbi:MULTISPECIES: lipoprotein [Streptomyces]|uniref:lipoprotein n=1 Tax=Streptomyces TaxID=1883 RepID=UPI0004CCEA60|nr:lipoprotein [Streptomyces durhamensis]
MRPLLPAGAALLALGLSLTACTTRADTSPRPSADDVVKAATRQLTDDCLAHRGLAPPRPGTRTPSPAGQQRLSEALFGTGPAELSVRLPTGYVVLAHTDGCLAAAQRRLYGDQVRWFRTSVVVDNLRPEATATHRTLAEVRARHRAEITEWQRLRTHAVAEATVLLTRHP